MVSATGRACRGYRRSRGRVWGVPLADSQIVAAGFSPPISGRLARAKPSRHRDLRYRGAIDVIGGGQVPALPGFSDTPVKRTCAAATPAFLSYPWQLVRDGRHGRKAVVYCTRGATAPVRPGGLRYASLLQSVQARLRRPRGLARAPGAVFLDRDGVINRNRHDYVRAWTEFEFLPGALAALARLKGAGRRVIVVTNQSIVGRGLVDAGDLARLHDRMREAVAAAGGEIEEVLVCPHHPASGCTCRKPRPGLLLTARDQLGVDLRRSVLVGDHVTDLTAAVAAGCAALLVLSGRTPAGAGHGPADGACLGKAWDVVPAVLDLGAAVDLLLGAPREVAALG